MAAQGRDVKLAIPPASRATATSATKLWNATRFAEMNGVARRDGFENDAASFRVNRWILTEVDRIDGAGPTVYAAYRFNEASAAAYRFVWNTVCDWYVELLKPVFMGDDEAAKAESRRCMAFVLDETCKLLHPIMPFITEELWAHNAGEGQGRATLLCHAAWPQPDFEDEEAAADLNWLIALVSDIRSVRAEMNVPPAAIAPLVVLGANATTKDRLVRHEQAIRRLARVGDIALADAAPAGSAQIVAGEATVCLPLGTLIDLKAEQARLAKEIAKVKDEIGRIDKKLGNPQFVAKAAPEVVEVRSPISRHKPGAPRKLSSSGR
jgi:valyl-tRNA synthetase